MLAKTCHLLVLPEIHRYDFDTLILWMILTGPLVQKKV
jgi:hypothetical protein